MWFLAHKKIACLNRTGSPETNIRARGSALPAKGLIIRKLELPSRQHELTLIVLVTEDSTPGACSSELSNALAPFGSGDSLWPGLSGPVNRGIVNLGASLDGYL
jgi:hypothetical protein